MQENKVLSGVVDTLLEKEISRISVPHMAIARRSIIDKLLFRRRKTIEVVKEFIIRPIKVCNWSRVAGVAVLLPNELIDGTFAEGVLPLMADELVKDRMVYLVASAIQNDLHEPSPDLIAFINDHFDAKTMSDAVTASLDAMGMPDFLNTITLAKGSINFLKAEESPIDGSELIASHTG